MTHPRYCQPQSFAELIDLIENGNKTKIKFSNKEIHLEQARDLAKYLRSSNRITHMNLTNNKLDDLRTIILCRDGLTHNSSLQHLTLSFNAFGDAAASALAKWLKDAWNITKLEITYNRITNKGALELFKALDLNVSITDFLISESKVHTEILRKALPYLERNMNLTNIKLANMALSNESRIRIMRIQTRNKRIYLQKIATFVQAKDAIQSCIWKHAKLILVGDSGVGKTTLCSLLQGQRSTCTSTTQSINVHDVNVTGSAWQKSSSQKNYLVNAVFRAAYKEIEAVAKKEIPFVYDKDSTPKPGIIHEFEENYNRERSMRGCASTVSIWDLGTDELHRIFLSTPGMFALVLDLHRFEMDLEKEIDRARTWIRKIKLSSPLAQICIIGSKLNRVKEENLPYITASIKKLQDENNRLHLLPHFGKSNGDIKEIRSSIESLLEAEEASKQEINLKWLHVAGELDTLETRCGVLPFEKIANIAESHGISTMHEVHEVHEMLRYFHQVGIALYFTNSTPLEDFICVDPEKLCKSVMELHDLRKKKAPPGVSRAELNQDVNTFVKNGVASQDLAEYFWGRTECFYVYELLKKFLILNPFINRQNEMSFFLIDIDRPVKDMRAQIHIDHTKLQVFRFNFGGSVLYNGIFERLVCLCCAYATDKPKLLESLLNQEIAILQFDPNRVVKLARLESEIVVLVEQYTDFCIIHSMLNKIRQESIQGPLVWKVIKCRQSMHDVNEPPLCSTSLVESFE